MIPSPRAVALALGEGNIAVEGVSLKSSCSDVTWRLEGSEAPSRFLVAPAPRDNPIVLTADLLGQTDDEIVRSAECVLTDTMLNIPLVEARKGIDTTKVVLWLTGSLGATAAVVLIPYLVIGVRARRGTEP